MRYVLPTQTPTSDRFGFKFGDKGTHTSRTIMVEELSGLLTAAGPQGTWDDHVRLSIEENALGKATHATRKLTLQRMRELYGLDASIPLFRVMRQLWFQEDTGRPLLALLCSLARDPLLRATAPVVLGLPVGNELARQPMTDAVRTSVGSRLNESSADKVVRNASSSWTQSGHLSGRNRKFRQTVKPTPAAAAYAVTLGFMLGLRGQTLLDSFWTNAIDAGPALMSDLLVSARRSNWIVYKVGGDVVEIGAPLLSEQEREWSNEPH